MYFLYRFCICQRSVDNNYVRLAWSILFFSILLYVFRFVLIVVYAIVLGGVRFICR